MRAMQPELPKSSAVRGQLISDQHLGSKTLLSQQLAHESERRGLIAAALDQHVEDLALMVDRSPQVHAFAGDPDDHFVEVPSAVRGGSAAAQLAGDRRAEFQNPAPHRFVGDIEPPLGQKLFDIAVAEREPQIQPYRMPDYSRRKPVPAVRELDHPSI